LVVAKPILAHLFRDATLRVDESRFSIDEADLGK
jgi:hypothetical protein